MKISLAPPKLGKNFAGSKLQGLKQQAMAFPGSGARCPAHGGIGIMRQFFYTLPHPTLSHPGRG